MLTAKIGLLTALWIGLVLSFASILITKKFILGYFQWIICIGFHIVGLYGAYKNKKEFLKPMLIFYIFVFLLLCVSSMALLTLIIYVIAIRKTTHITDFFGEYLPLEIYPVSDGLLALIIFFLLVCCLASTLLYVVINVNRYIRELVKIDKLEADEDEPEEDLDAIYSDARRHSLDMDGSIVMRLPQNPSKICKSST